MSLPLRSGLDISSNREASSRLVGRDGVCLRLERSPGTRHMETYLYQLGMRARGVCVLHLNTKLTDLQTDALLDGSTQIDLFRM